MRRTCSPSNLSRTTDSPGSAECERQKKQRKASPEASLGAWSPKLGITKVPSRSRELTIGAVIIAYTAYTISGVPYYDHRKIFPKTLVELL